jgi:site-specific DNA-methyltransferase (adenine-specific)
MPNWNTKQKNKKKKRGMGNFNKTWLDYSVYCGEKLKLYHGDCLEVMDLMIEDKTKVDMILCDLPYGTTACKWDTIIPFVDLWKRYEKLIKPNGAIVLTASQPFTSSLVMSNINNFRYELIWEKNFSGGFILAKKQPMKYHENILVFYKAQPTYNPIFEQYADTTKNRFKNNGKVNSSKLQSANYVNEIQGIKRVQDEVKLDRGAYPKSVQKIKGVPNCNGGRLHPTQKPVELMEYLIKTYTNEGEIVLDNCIGSGTTAVGCINTNRYCIGIEKDKTIYDIAVKRLNDIWVSKQNKNELF